MKSLLSICSICLLIFSCSSENGSSEQNSTQEDNNLPVMQIQLTPVSPLRGEPITANYSYSVPGVDSMYNLWIVENETLAVRSKTLETSQLPLGATIKTAVFVFFHDGQNKTFVSPSVTLGTPASASIAAARIGPDSVTVAGTIRLMRVEIIGDRTNFSFESQWYKNGLPVAGANDTVLALAGFRRGDELMLRLIDGNGVEYSTNTVIITNAIPSIVSSPPFVSGGGAYTYQIMSNDHDGDPLSYSLTQAPAGMTISGTGLITWEIPSEGSHAVTVEVDDGNGGKAAQTFTLKFAVDQQ
ncbi:putative Ig domain-containing protein [candidate division WOR-3 bacterium]|nr:putative Ig domain-containing protein [candidate division WOR-3 bacterium]